MKVDFCRLAFPSTDPLAPGVERREIEVLHRNGGLVLTRDLTGNGWSISRAHCGKRLAVWPRPIGIEEAREALDALATVCDWTAPNIASDDPRCELVLLLIACTGGVRP